MTKAGPPIPVFQPMIGVDTIKAVVDAPHAGWLGMGAATQAFEEGLARFLGLNGRYVLATNTGTSALHLGLLAAGVGAGDEVITPALRLARLLPLARFTRALLIDLRVPPHPCLLYALLRLNAVHHVMYCRYRYPRYGHLANRVALGLKRLGG